MKYKFDALKTAFIFSMLLSVLGSSHAEKSYECQVGTDQLIKNKNIEFCLPSKFESFSMQNEDLSAPQKESKKILKKYRFFLTKRISKSSVFGNAGSICLGALDDCEKMSTAEIYWRDKETGQFHIGDPTVIVYPREIGSWSAYEAFPLCAWNSKNGDFHPAKGQCYAIVLSSKEKTIDFQILLGENKGCIEIEKCWAVELNLLRRMLASMK